jgi:hypothetical protein
MGREDRRDEDILGADEKGREAQEANEDLHRKRTERPSTPDGGPAGGRVGSPD